MLKRKVKKIITAAKRRIHYWHDKKDYSSIDRDERKNAAKIVLLGTPEYNNSGDIAISYATKKFILDNFPECLFWEFTENQIRYDMKQLKKLIHDEDLLLLQGGGNLNDVYADQNIIRSKILKNFPNNSIILMPQSCIFHDTARGKKVEKNIQHKFDIHKNFVLFARDEISEKRMRSYFSNRVNLVPDIVLSLGEVSVDSGNREGIGLCIRSDIESNTEMPSLHSITETIQKCQKKCVYLDTVLKNDIEITERDAALRYIWNKFASCELVITDRLHGVIFAYITDTPCAAINTNNDKIAGICKWFIESDNVILCESGELTADCIENLLTSDTDKNKQNFDRILSKFIPLKDQITYLMENNSI